MSSRVRKSSSLSGHTKYINKISEKGGLVFKPVVKSRPRTVSSTSRQASVLVETNNTGVSAEYDASSSNSRHAIETSGHAATHAESSIMVDRSNSIPIVNPTSSRIYPRPPLISSSSNNFITTPSSVPVTKNREPMSSTSTIDSTVSDVDLQRNQSNVQAPMVQSANVASTSTTFTASSTTPLFNEEDVPDASASQKRASKFQSKSLKGTKKRKASSDEGSDDETTRDEFPLSKQRRTRASSGTPRPRKRVPSPLPYDPNGDPGEDIDPTSVTMAALCTDTGQGRVSRKAAEILANHTAWKAKNKEKRSHMRNLMELKKYGREEESEHDRDVAQAQPVEDAASTSTPGTSNAPATAPVLDDTGNGFDYSQGLATSRYNVQVRIGPNGETIIDEESLVVDRVENDGTDDYTHVIESDHTKFVNSGTYGKRYRSSRWSAEETERFFDVSFLLLTWTFLHDILGSLPVWRKL
jgi:transcription factor TFIIIB component B''